MNTSTENHDSSLQRYMQDIAQYPLLSLERENELAALIKTGDKKAIAEMVRCNLRLVVKIAREYANFGVPLLDLISEGNIGLMKAVKRFDPSKGSKLSTYSSWWIKQAIKRALANQGKTVRLPIHLLEKVAKVRRVNDSLNEFLGREATHEEISEEIGISVEKIAQLKLASGSTTSLDAPVSEESSTKFSDMLSDSKALNPFDELDQKDLQDSLQEMIGGLTLREREVINNRFGLNGEEPITLEEVGSKMGVTRERIRQLQNVALSKMRQAFQKKEQIRFYPEVVLA
ncbi:MAG: RNA polymerase sigma factor RpoD/SigA [Chthoniobacterales bacterium]|nr:RNA polymerase sigma factor RpoD/SigA [Chthoniobacterales bacterium]